MYIVQCPSLPKVYLALCLQIYRYRYSIFDIFKYITENEKKKKTFNPKVFFGKCMNCVVQDKKCSLVSNSQYHMCSPWHCLTVANCWPPPHTIIWISAGDDVLINYKCGRQMSRLISTPLTPVHAPLSPVIADCGSSVSPDRDQAAGRLLLTRASNGGSRRFHNHREHSDRITTPNRTFL